MIRRRAVLGGAALALTRPALAGPADLTEIGAEVSGNADGSIPPYRGGLTGAFGSNPFESDLPLQVLGAAHADDPRLTPGHAAMLRASNRFQIRLFPTRRSATLPAFVSRSSVANLGRARLSDSGNAVLNAATGIPFPRPENGLQVIWNHMLRWRFHKLSRVVGVAAPLASGWFTPQRWEDRTIYPYNNPDATPGDLGASVSQLLSYKIIEPASAIGAALVSRQPTDFDRGQTLYWFYVPALRRVVLSSNNAFDVPNSAADGLRTIDQADMFAGSPERYAWKLLGKREAIVPYNSHTLYDPARSIRDIIKPEALAPELTRYELHRVWVVEATLRPGQSHRYARRVCYFDEDSWQMLLAEHYDGAGRLWRVSEAHPIQYSGPVPSFYASIDVSYDIPSRRYAVFGLPNGEAPMNVQPRLTEEDFSPDALRSYAIR